MKKDMEMSPHSSELKFRPSPWDDKTDDDIVNLVLSDRPVTSPKNVWAFWHSGWYSMKPWRQRNIISWVRRLHPSWQVRVLNTVPDSPRHFSRFLKPDELPEVLVKNKMDTQARNWAEHASDMIRLPLLYKYGGVWLDVGFFLLDDLEDICWNALSDPTDPHELCVALMPINSTESYMLNGFIASLPANPFLKYWHSIFCALWEDQTSCSGMSSSTLLASFPQWSVTSIYQTTLGADVTHETYNDYLAHMVASNRLVHIIDPDTGFNGPEYWNTKIRFFGVEQVYPLHEAFTGAAGFSERRQFELYELRRELDLLKRMEDPEQMEAERFVEGTLETAVLKKMTKGVYQKPTLASIWDVCGDADARPGTWGEYLRWGCVHLVKAKTPSPAIVGTDVQRLTVGYRMGITEAIPIAEAEVVRVYEIEEV